MVGNKQQCEVKDQIAQQSYSASVHRAAACASDLTYKTSSSFFDRIHHLQTSFHISTAPVAYVSLHPTLNALVIRQQAADLRKSRIRSDFADTV